MAKKLIRLTEEDLHKIVKESVKRILREDSSFDEHIAARIIDDLERNGKINRKMRYNQYIMWIMKQYACSQNVATIVADKCGIK